MKRVARKRAQRWRKRSKIHWSEKIAVTKVLLRRWKNKPFLKNWLLAAQTRLSSSLLMTWDLMVKVWYIKYLPYTPNFITLQRAKNFSRMSNLLRKKSSGESGVFFGQPWNRKGKLLLERGQHLLRSLEASHQEIDLVEAGVRIRMPITRRASDKFSVNDNKVLY